MEITKREVLVSIVIFLLMLSLGFFISNGIHNYTMVENEKYFKAVKINNNPELFNYAIDTEVGHMLSSGTVKASKLVSDPMIKGEYLSIKKIKEHYTMHTRTVSYTCGKSTCHRTETYWTWDEVDREVFNTETFNYLGIDFDYGKIKFNNYSYNDTIQEDIFSNDRYVFYTIPKEFNVTMYSKAVDKDIANNAVYYNQTIKDVMSEKENEADVSVIVFWIVWVVLILGAVIGFVALDNRFINNK